jgi:neutral ceramidase
MNMVYFSFQLQRYEAASTLYGKHTLTIYQRQYKKLVIATITNTTLKPGKQPANFEKDAITLLPPVIFDTTPWDKNYGSCLRQPKNKTYYIGDKVTATFVSNFFLLQSRVS